MVLLVPLVVLLTSYVNSTMEDEDKARYYVSLGVVALVVLLPKFIPWFIKVVTG